MFFFFKAVILGLVLWVFLIVEEKNPKKRQLPVDFNYDVFGFDVQAINLFLRSSFNTKRNPTCYNPRTSPHFLGRHCESLTFDIITGSHTYFVLLK